jgi:hypothetical protein
VVMTGRRMKISEMFIKPFFTAETAEHAETNYTPGVTFQT